VIGSVRTRGALAHVSLLPGETRTLTARYELATLEGKEPVLETDGWNVATSAR
jgi:hypothetical protein